MEKIIEEFTCIPFICSFDTDKYKIYAVDVNENNFPNIKKNKYGNYTILGNIHNLGLGIEYHVKAEEQKSKNGYGYQYKIIHIQRDRPTNENTTRMFLSELLTPDQVKTIMESYPNIIDIVINNRLDEIDLKKLYNIGQFRFNIIRQKIEENFVFAELIEMFQGLLDMKTVRKLYDKYPSTLKIKQEIQNEPYHCLCSLSQISFKTADSIILELDKESKAQKKKGETPLVYFDFDIKTSVQRAVSAIEYLLEQNENDGHTRISIVELRTQFDKLVLECSDKFVEAIKKSDDFHVDKESKAISILETYNTELYIAERLIEGLKKENKWNEIEINEFRKIGDDELTDEQFNAVKMFYKNNISILNGNAGCVDCDTEYFNGTKWVKISEYEYKDKVLQYNKNGTAELVSPLEYHKYPADYLWHFKTRYRVDQCLSDEHNVIYTTQYNHQHNTKKLFNKPFKEIRELQQTGKGFSGRFINTFKVYGTGVNYNEWELRLLIAIIADGTFRQDDRTDNCYFNVKKDRKKQRIEYLLDKNNISYKYYDKEDGFTTYRFQYPEVSKTFNSCLYNCNLEQFKIIYDEIFKWDGDSINKNKYYSTIKNNADFIQFVGTVLGYKCSIYCEELNERIRKIDDRIINRNYPIWTVYFSKTNTSGINCDKRESRDKWTQIEKYKTLDGYKYCFTVPSSMLVLRRNNSIFITGNSGKSFTTQSILSLVKALNKSFALFCPTGRASKILSGYTHEDASTIHRGLAFNPSIDPQWGYNEKCKLPYDVIMVDEMSMTDVFLMKKLIEAIDFSRTKLLFIGDDFQISSVGAGNVLYDLINSGIIPIISLTKIFRFGIGGISTISTKTRYGESWIEDKTKINIFGEDKGYIYMPMQQNQIMPTIKSLYTKLMNNSVSPEDILILSSYNIGDYGTEKINEMIQQIANKNYDSDLKFKCGNTTYYLDDIVIQTKNNYKAIVYNPEDFNPFDDEMAMQTFISNGDIGKVILIDSEYMVIQFDNEKIVYDRDMGLNLKLAYSISMHKSQGGSCKNIIMITPKAHTFMLNANLIYVGQTRAEQRCYHLGDPDTINKALKKKANLNRKTHLKDMLIKLNAN